MDIIEFAEHMFVRNRDDRKIALNLQGIENNKDLFMFMIDLFCKGLILCYGDGKSIDFESLTVEKFDHVKRKMANAGIVIKLSVIENETYMPTRVNSAEIEAMPENDPLESYNFKIHHGYNTYLLHFGLSHSV